SVRAGGAPNQEAQLLVSSRAASTTSPPSTSGASGGIGVAWGRPLISIGASTAGPSTRKARTVQGQGLGGRPTVRLVVNEPRRSEDADRVLVWSQWTLPPSPPFPQVCSEMIRWPGHPEPFTGT